MKINGERYLKGYRGEFAKTVNLINFVHTNFEVCLTNVSANLRNPSAATIMKEPNMNLKIRVVQEEVDMKVHEMTGLDFVN